MAGVGNSMNHLLVKNQIRNFWKKYSTTIILAIILAVFSFYAIFIALRIKTGIIPDEITHYLFSRLFSTTIGIPSDTLETITRGVYIKNNPFLYYWINGRVINILDFIWPSINYWQTLVSLRILNIFYSIGTIIFCYLLTKEFICNKWWQLFPIFLLTNTIMFVFLAGGVNYDNLTNLFVMIGLFFLARVLNHRDFLPNSLAWMIFICAGALTKYTVLPLALGMLIIWILFLVKDHKKVTLQNFKKSTNILLFLILFILVIGNIAIYGFNLVFYQSILPPCEKMFPKSQCDLGFFHLQQKELGLEEKLTISESISLGYPGPIEYLFLYWIPIMFSHLFGVFGHQSYYSYYQVIIHILIFYFFILNALFSWRNFSFFTIWN